MLAQKLEIAYEKKPKDTKYYAMLELANNADRRLKLLNILRDDTKHALEEIQLNRNNPYLQRTLVRTLFANIEGELAIIKQTVFDWYRARGCELTQKELEMLVDMPIVIGSNPEIDVLPKHLGLKESLKFSYKIYALKLGEIRIKIDDRDRGWDSFCKAIKIRDALMHPKTEKDLQLTELDMQYSAFAWLWFDETSTNLRNKVTEKFADVVARKISATK